MVAPVARQLEYGETVCCYDTRSPLENIRARGRLIYFKISAREAGGSWLPIFLAPPTLQLITATAYCIWATDEDYLSYWKRRDREAARRSA